MTWTATLRDLTVGDGTAYWWRERGSAPFDLGADVLYRTVRTDNQQAHGQSSPGGDYLSGKLLTFRVSILSDDDAEDPQADALTKLALLNYAWRPATAAEGDRVPLTLVTPFQTLTYYGKPDRLPTATIDNIDAGVIAADLTFAASDPRAYDLAEEVTITARPPEGGLSFPFSFPFAFGAALPGRATVVNVGTAPAPWTLDLRGTFTNPTVRVGRTRLDLDVNVAGGNAIRIDSRRRTVLFGSAADDFAGAAPRNDLIHRPGAVWADLDSDLNTIAITTESGEVSARIVWRAGWLF